MSIASSAPIGYSMQGVSGANGLISHYESRPDVGVTQGNIALRYQDAAENSFNSAIGTLNDLLSSISADGNNSQMKASFDKLESVSGNLMDVYGSLGGTKESLSGYANELGGLHDTIKGIGDSATSRP